MTDDDARLDRLARVGLADDQRSSLGSGALALGLGVVALGLVVLLGLLVHHDRHPADGATPGGDLTAAPARAEALAAAARLTQTTLSYRWSTLDQDTASAQQVMSPAFRAQYVQAMAKVHDQTLTNHITLKATAVAASLVSLSDHEAKALVFVDQDTTARGSTNQRRDQSRVVVTLTRTGGDWRVSKLDAF